MWRPAYVASDFRSRPCTTTSIDERSLEGDGEGEGSPDAVLERESANRLSPVCGCDLFAVGCICLLDCDAPLLAGPFVEACGNGM